MSDTSDDDLTLTNVPANTAIDASVLQPERVASTPPTVSTKTRRYRPSPARPLPGTTFLIGTTTDMHRGRARRHEQFPRRHKTFTVTVNGAAEQPDALSTAVTGAGPAARQHDHRLPPHDVATGDRTGACSTLDGFVSEVKAQSERSSRRHKPHHSPPPRRESRQSSPAGCSGAKAQSRMDSRNALAR